MNKIISIWIAFIFGLQISAQKGIDSLIQAEKDFAAYSVAHGTKEAFLKFLDSNGIVFDNSKPVNGIDTWSKREKRPGVLNWFPLCAEISASGDFGYTTGPWTFQPETVNDSVIARGQYTTVWHKDKNGEWKFLVDLGCNNTPPSRRYEPLKIERTNPYYKQGNETALLTAEKKFIRTTRRSSDGAYKKFMSKTFCLLNRNAAEPAWYQDAYFEILKSTPEKIAYTTLGSGIASSGDLGYVYGATVIHNKTDNYFRIWRKEQDGWKIAVEVLRY